jgi:drug/metabolite transporter (DMT)-like permease
MSLSVTVDMLGWLGALILIAAYVVVSYSEASGRSPVYQALNVVGSALLVVNTAWYRAWPSSAVNILWAAIGIGALIRATAPRAESGGSPTELHDTSRQETNG